LFTFPFKTHGAQQRRVSEVKVIELKNLKQILARTFSRSNSFSEWAIFQSANRESHAHPR